MSPSTRSRPDRTIASVTSTLCRLMAEEPPALATAPVLDEILAAAQAELERDNRDASRFADF